MIFIDTSALIDSFSGQHRSALRLRALIEAGEMIVLSSLVLFEWLRGPRLGEELRAVEKLFPAAKAVPFAAAEAEFAAKLYRKMRTPRGREIDLAIAATAIIRNARVWTLNRADFEDIPSLELV